MSINKYNEYYKIVVWSYGINFINSFFPLNHPDSYSMLYIFYFISISSILISIIKLKLKLNEIFKILSLIIIFNLFFCFINFYTKAIISTILSTIVLYKVLKYIDKFK